MLTGRVFSTQSMPMAGGCGYSFDTDKWYTLIDVIKHGGVQ